MKLGDAFILFSIWTALIIALSLVWLRILLSVCRQTHPLIHYARTPFVSICGANVPNQRTTQRADDCTCMACFHAMKHGLDLTILEQTKIISALNQRTQSLRSAMVRQQESHYSIAVVLEDPTQAGIASCCVQAAKFADEAKRAIEE